jgi:superkiller protein 3
LKCYQKAFELDPREDRAARLLADEFATSGEWDLVEVVARRVIEGTGRDNITGAELPAVGSLHAAKYAWAHRAIGAAELVRPWTGIHSHPDFLRLTCHFCFPQKAKHYLTAITSFQSALRGEPKDVHAWMKLGLAYRGSGKPVAALKTFARTLELDPSMWQAKFCIGDVQRSIGLLDPAVNIFESILQELPDEIGVQVVLAETRLSRARAHLRAGFLTRAEESLVEALVDACAIIETGRGLRVAWKVAAETLSELGRLQSFMFTEAQRGTITSLLKALRADNVDSKLGGLDAVNVAGVASKVGGDHEMPSHVVSSALAVLAGKMRVLLETGEGGENVGTAWFDLALAFNSASDLLPSYELSPPKDDLLRNAIQCLRFALKHEPSNAIFWNALGVLTFNLSPRLAQHAFIRAVEVTSRVGAIRMSRRYSSMLTHVFLFFRVQFPGRISGFSTWTMKITLWRIRLFSRHRLSIPSGRMPGSAKLALHSSMAIRQKRKSLRNMPLAWQMVVL